MGDLKGSPGCRGDVGAGDVRGERADPAARKSVVFRSQLTAESPEASGERRSSDAGSCRLARAVRRSGDFQGGGYWERCRMCMSEHRSSVRLLFPFWRPYSRASFRGKCSELAATNSSSSSLKLSYSARNATLTRALACCAFIIGIFSSRLMKFQVCNGGVHHVPGGYTTAVDICSEVAFALQPVSRRNLLQPRFGMMRRQSR